MSLKRVMKRAHKSYVTPNPEHTMWGVCWVPVPCLCEPVVRFKHPPQSPPINFLLKLSRCACTRFSTVQLWPSCPRANVCLSVCVHKSCGVAPGQAVHCSVDKKELQCTLTTESPLLIVQNHPCQAASDRLSQYKNGPCKTDNLGGRHPVI